MVIFHSYVSLPEGISFEPSQLEVGLAFCHDFFCALKKTRFYKAPPCRGTGINGPVQVCEVWSYSPWKIEKWDPTEMVMNDFSIYRIQRASVPSGKFLARHANLNKFDW